MSKLSGLDETVGDDDPQDDSGIDDDLTQQLLGEDPDGGSGGEPEADSDSDDSPAGKRIQVGTMMDPDLYAKLKSMSARKEIPSMAEFLNQALRHAINLREREVGAEIEIIDAFDPRT